MSRSLALAIACLSLPCLAEAKTYRAGPFATGPGSQIRCEVLNVSTKPAEVEVRFYNGSDVVGNVSPRTLAPGENAFTTIGAPPVVTHCEFDISTSRKKVRMLACTQSSNGDCIAVYPVD